MLYFSRVKILAILAFCLVFVYLALPSMTPSSMRTKLPTWLQGNTVNLGLDLRGGSHLLLQLDFKAYMREQTENLRSDVRVALRGADIGYNGVSVEGKEVVADIKRETIKEDKPLSQVIRELDSGLEFTEEGNLVRLHYSDAALRTKQQQLIEQSIEIVGRRINESGLKEPIIQRQGDDRILLQVPGLEDPKHLKEILGKTAKMTFHLVNQEVGEAQALSGSVPLGTKLLPMDDSNKMTPNEKTRQLPIFTRVELSGEMLTGAAVAYDENNQPAVSFKFNTAGARKFGDITRENVDKPFAIVLDDKIITAPVIRSPILGGSGIISGNFTLAQANDLALLLRAGALPAPLTVVEERSVGPSLGADSIDAGIISAEVAFGGIAFFMILSYGLFGGFAIAALTINMVMILGALSLFQATLTLPGIAGIILTMGMAVDANVLIFERIREEIKRGRNGFSAVENGFKGAQATILDSNITTLLAAFLLYYFGTGTVKGFAVTLSIGITASMFSAVILTRLMVATWMQAKRPKVIPI
jgi:preprotein translocase subunit SecD